MNSSGLDRRLQSIRILLKKHLIIIFTFFFFFFSVFWRGRNAIFLPWTPPLQKLLRIKRVASRKKKGRRDEVVY